jgi:hypothetical protein
MVDLRDRGVKSLPHIPKLFGSERRVSSGALYTQTIHFTSPSQIVPTSIVTLQNVRLATQPRRPNLRQWLQPSSSHRRMRIGRTPQHTHLPRNLKVNMHPSPAPLNTIRLTNAVAKLPTASNEPRAPQYQQHTTTSSPTRNPTQIPSKLPAHPTTPTLLP